MVWTNEQLIVRGNLKSHMYVSELVIILMIVHSSCIYEKTRHSCDSLEPNATGSICSTSLLIIYEAIPQSEDPGTRSV
ncbi:hypothetical protein Lmor_1122 [Legionella moravica]|uniref:Uncharacterized protein n=1 Tax=Legionella moravica TaxID=39962 RepID=A0A378JVR9_9GAMM|nr:hypothetical protein Lmor_1122 [Legionella moravica]STX62805.1 Uncharacterised protein [Legionella moravica]